MIPSGIHQIDLSLKHAQVIGVGGEFTVVPARVAGSSNMCLLIPVDEDTFEVVSNRVDLATETGRAFKPRDYEDDPLIPEPPLPGHTWTTLSFNDADPVVTADRGTVHDYDGDGIWTWHDDQYECVECQP